MNIRFTDEIFVNTFIYTCIAIDRFKHGKTIDGSAVSLDHKNIFSAKEVGWMNENIGFVEKQNDMKLNDAEKEYMLTFMFSANKYFDLEEIQDQQSAKR